MIINKSVSFALSLALFVDYINSKPRTMSLYVYPLKGLVILSSWHLRLVAHVVVIVRDRCPDFYKKLGRFLRVKSSVVALLYSFTE